MPRKAPAKAQAVSLLIDGDILAFRAVAANYHQIEWEPDLWTYHVDMASAKAAFASQVRRVRDAVQPDTVALVTTQAGGYNFRHAILPSYKGGRKQKPPGYRSFQEWIAAEGAAEIGYRHFEREGLEGDDVLGILATSGDDILPGLKVIFSADKDLKQIAGLHWRENGSDFATVTPYDADYFHAYQTLMGDATDGYTGLPGFGPKRADAVLEGLRGDLAAMWRAVEAEYVKKGLTRDDMLVQARVSRILRADDFDFDTRKPILWEPPT